MVYNIKTYWIEIRKFQFESLSTDRKNKMAGKDYYSILGVKKDSERI